MELRYKIQARILLLFMLGATLSTLALLIFMYNPLALITAKVISFSPNSIAFELWKKPPYEILIRVYVFNVTNSNEFLEGKEKLRVQEVGPYVYREELFIVNSTFNKNGTLTFLQQRHLRFLPEKSVGDHNVDTIISPNVPLLGITGSLVDSSIFTNLAVASASTYLGSNSFLNITINEYLWGYDDPLVTLANNVVPNWIDFPRFGIFDRIMALDNGSNIVTMNLDPEQTSSVDEPLDVYAIEKWNGSPGLRQWGYITPKDNKYISTNTKCNTLEGASMGNIFPPNLEENSTFRLYRHAFCRTIPVEFDKKVDKDGFEGYLYRQMDSFLKSPENCSENACYCLTEKCLPDGLGDMTPCYYGIPVVMSLPHFLNADPKLLNDVNGLSPDKKKHSLSMIVHPKMGVLLEAKLRLQVNLNIPDTTYNPKVKPFNNLVIPLFWVELWVENPPSEIQFYLRLLYKILPVIQTVLMYSFAIIGIVLIFGSAIGAVRHVFYSRHTSHFGLNVNYSEIPVFSLKSKVLTPHILINK